MEKTMRCILFALLCPCLSLCQLPCKQFYADSITDNQVAALRKEFGQNKKYPAQFEKQILIALSYYPELKNTPIFFRIRPRHTSLNTRCTWGGLFETQANRHYVITISDSTEPMLTPMLFKNLSFNAQIGVMGHELGHVTDFSRMTTMQIVGHVVKNVSARYIDRFEFNTDNICINHGLGYQLLEWSSYVRKTMNREIWRGPDFAHRKMTKERYMNPSTIIRKLETCSIYNQKSSSGL